MKKYIKISMVLLAGLISILYTEVDAATASVSLKCNKSTLVVGNSTTCTATLSSNVALGAWQYQTGYTPKLNYTGGSTLNAAPVANNDTTKAVSYSFTFKAISAGNATVSFKTNQIAAWNEGDPISNLPSASANIKIITQADVEASYSKNNNLSSLSIEGYELSPAFNKDTLEYTVELPNDVTSIKVNANKEDNSASVEGAGEISVSEGNNKIEIKVTAQNGGTKTYIINATVIELDPINVKVDGKELTVVRKKEQLTPPNSTYKENVIKIDDLDVPVLINKKIGFTLVGLKDKEGNIQLYIYDVKKKSYSLYNEYNFKQLIIYIIDDSSKIPSGYTKTTIKIDGKKTTAYKQNKTSNFALVYGINLETGKEGLYVYDSKEQSIQRYNPDLVEDYLENEKIYQYIIIGVGSCLILTYLVILISLITKSKRKKVRQNMIAKKLESIDYDNDEKN